MIDFQELGFKLIAESRTKNEYELEQKACVWTHEFSSGQTLIVPEKTLEFNDLSTMFIAIIRDLTKESMRAATFEQIFLELDALFHCSSNEHIQRDIKDRLSLLRMRTVPNSKGFIVPGSRSYGDLNSFVRTFLGHYLYLHRMADEFDSVASFYELNPEMLEPVIQTGQLNLQDMTVLFALLRRKGNNKAELLSNYDLLRRYLSELQVSGKADAVYSPQMVKILLAKLFSSRKQGVARAVIGALAEQIKPVMLAGSVV